MGKRHIFRIFLGLLAAALLVFALPGTARAEETVTFQRALCPEDAVDGQYVLIASGLALGPMGEDGSFPALSPQMDGGYPAMDENLLWTLQWQEGRLLLTDPTGKALAPEGGWELTCHNMLFRFSCPTEDGTLTLGYSGGVFAAAPEEETTSCEFSLFRLKRTSRLPAEETPAQEERAGLYFGLLHCHTGCSDGTGTPEEAFAGAAAEMDFLALTDHGDSLTAEEWDLQRAAALTAATEDFLGLRGWEMSWPEGKRLGHLGVFGTETFRSWKEDRYENPRTGLKTFYDDLSGETGAVLQFQHPGNLYGNFQNFTYDEGADQAVQLLEVWCEGEDYRSAYTAALDKGWHIPPTLGGSICDGGACGTGTGRTAVLAESLTEEAMLDALRSRRTYATMDSDLQISFTVDASPMGSILPRRKVGATAELDITLSDPTDAACGQVEILGPGGRVLSTQTLDSNPGRVTLSLPAEESYYYLRVTQPDGDWALTAPVWVEQSEDAGIAEFSCATAVPLQGEAVELTLTLKNGESAPLEVNGLELLLNGEPLLRKQEPFSVAPGTTVEIPLTYVHEKPGTAELRVRVSAALEGAARNYEAALTLSARRSDLVTGILVDGAHGNAGTGSLSELTRLAAEQNIALTISPEIIDEEMLDRCALLMVTAPDRDFSGDFLAAAAEFVSTGGRILVCGDDPARAGRLNLLLANIGSSLSLGETLPEQRPRDFNPEQPLCAGINENQSFYTKRGCALDNAGENWLVKTREGKVLMARERVGQGEVLVCGSLMMEDAALKAPASLWEEEFANRTMALALLGITREPIPITDIRQVRAGQEGEIYRIQGYVTATTFPGELFLQDRTGGIGIAPFTGEKIPQGSAVEIIGTLSLENGEPVLNPISLELPEQKGYWYRPQSLTCREAQNLSLYGGQLVQLTGICTGRTLNNRGILESFILKDSTGRTMTVSIGPEIVSSATGRNDLHGIVAKGEEIWAIGILQVDDTGSPYLRVRNCAEVVAVEPIPYTGDGVIAPMTALLLSAAALLVLRKRKYAK